MSPTQRKIEKVWQYEREFKKYIHFQEFSQRWKTRRIKLTSSQKRTKITPNSWTTINKKD